MRVLSNKLGGHATRSSGYAIHDLVTVTQLVGHMVLVMFIKSKGRLEAQTSLFSLLRTGSGTGRFQKLPLESRPARY